MIRGKLFLCIIARRRVCYLFIANGGGLRFRSWCEPGRIKDIDWLYFSVEALVLTRNAKNRAVDR